MSIQRREGYAKLLDAWTATKQAGDPVGCLATTFTFKPGFFEEECLARFLGLESDPDEDGQVYLVEREEKLAGATCGALVDARHCRGARSLRWDLLAARVPGGALHAKVALLCWQHLVRVIVTSANLTEDGYRRNQEVFGVLDFYDGSPAPAECLGEVTGFLRETASYAASGENVGPVIQRWQGLLARAWEIGGGTGSGDTGGIRIHPVLVGPGRSSAFEQLDAIWPRQTPPWSAQVVSPFFDPGPINAPAEGLWGLLRQRGPAEITYHVTAQGVPEKEDLVVHAPEALQRATPAGRQQVASHFARLLEANLAEEESVGSRPLHAKTLWLADGEWACALVGSSNFTTPGMGLSETPNLEANLAYCVPRERAPELFKALEASQLRGDPLDPEGIRYWQPSADETEAEEASLPSLPEAFQEAILTTDGEGGHCLLLKLRGSPPAGWRIYPEEGGDPLYEESAWREAGGPHEIRLPWDSTLPPTGLEVTWSGTGARAWWPVNVSDMTDLPPPEKLRGLSLAALIHILTCARPLKEAMRTWFQREQTAKSTNAYDPNEIDPHKRVDTAGFLLQRTRRVSWALAGLRERLERPVPTRQALRWRLHGPVGVRRVADALRSEKRSPEEHAFLLAELLLELSRVAPREARSCLPVRAYEEELREVVEELLPELRETLIETETATRTYIRSVISEIEKAFGTP